MKLERKSQDRDLAFQQRATALIIFSILIISCLLIILVFIYVLSVCGYTEIAITLVKNMPDILRAIALGGCIFLLSTHIGITIIFSRDYRRKKDRKGLST